MVIWALFDSGNGCYKQVGDTIDEIEIYSVGLDVENKNSHFLNQNLADYSRLFGSKDLWNSLDTLPKPDLIIASPPCESWSVARGQCLLEKRTVDRLGGISKRDKPIYYKRYR